MDLDIMASVQEQIIGNCLCVLGDAMAMPIGSMVEKFRSELEDEIEAARERAEGADLRGRDPDRGRRRARRPLSGPLTSARMPRPKQKIIQLTIDGREVRAPRARCSSTPPSTATSRSPTSATSRSSAHPVGACRMCLVEIEGIPKLQTSCSTPVKDGMVVHTQTDRVHHAQNAIVEFLLVNHPLDCPVCDKGGECPLQDITFGWGLGRVAVHRAQAPLREAARAVAADRDRPRALHPLLPLRALLAGDRRGLPADLHRARRPHVRRHLRRPPVRRPVQRQHHRAVPGRGADVASPTASGRGRGTSRAPAGICTLCPSQCNVELHGPRREGDARARARATPRASTTAGCATRAASPIRRSTSTSGSPSRSCATAAACDRSPGSARSRPRPGLARHRRRGRRARRRPGYERGGLPARAADARGARLLGRRLAREAQRWSADLARALAAPSLQATVPDLEFADTILVVGCEPLDDAPILDLRIRKGVRRNGVKLAIASVAPERARPERPAVLRYAARRARPRSWPRSSWRSPGTAARRGGSDTDAGRLARLLRDGGEDVVILWGERLLGEGALGALLSIADAPRPRRPRRRRPARDPRRGQRPRAARGRRAPGRRPRLRRRRRRSTAGRGTGARSRGPPLPAGS